MNFCFSHNLRRVTAVLLFAVLFGVFNQRAYCSPLVLHASGSYIYSSRGHEVVLKGVDICSMEWSPTGDHIVQSFGVAIDRWHVSIIRLPLAQDLWEGRENQTDGGAAYRALVDQLVAKASNAGVYVIVDLHWSDMDHWGSNVQQHDMPDDNTAFAWHDIASHFANNPAVLFDAYNEPHDVSWDIWRNGGMVNDGGVTYHSPGMQGIVDVIRATGARNIVLVGGLGFASDLTGIARGYAISGRNIAYSAHIYPATDPNWDTHIAVADKFGPIFVGEFGSDTSSDYAGFEPRILAWITRHRFSATAWCMHPAAGPCLIADWTYKPTYNEGAYVYSWLNGGPIAPYGLTASGAGGHIALSWDRAPGATSYAVYRSAVPGREQDGASIADHLNATQYVDDSAHVGDTFYYRVAAANSHAPSGLSENSGATAGIALGFGPPIPSFSMTPSAAQPSTTVNSADAISVAVTNTTKAPATPLLIALYINGPAGVSPIQQTQNDPGLDPGQGRTLTFTWTPASPGVYTINLGAFGAGWSPKYNWVSNAATITVK